MTGYGRLVAELGAAAARRDTALAAADRAYREGAATASAELARAAADAEAAERRAAADAEAVHLVDREAARLWEELRALRRWPGRPVGDLPEPDRAADTTTSAAATAGAATTPAATVEAATSAAARAATVWQESGGSGVGLSPAAQALERARQRIAAARPDAPRKPVPRLVLPFLPLVGAALAALTGLVAAGLVAIAPDGAASVPRVLGWLVFLVAPFTAIPPVAWWLRRTGSRLDVGAIGLLLLGGMAAGTILSLTLTH
ncbi:hypothetical protein AB0M79_06600 [Polymorphospora sp. NPDC051019]|uniref:hypothetical protein n=1 Tax=Polymorphospora sp. NPDC051019 TaxID=3155725 RepID=UPI003442BC25